jgi:hypothetical protein
VIAGLKGLRHRTGPKGLRDLVDVKRVRHVRTPNGRVKNGFIAALKPDASVYGSTTESQDCAIPRAGDRRSRVGAGRRMQKACSFRPTVSSLRRGDSE